MAGGKQKGNGWNPFKRSRKLKLPEETVLDPYENGLYSQPSESSSKMDSFSVTSDQSDEKNYDGDAISSMDLQPKVPQPGNKKPNQSTLETKIVETTQDSSFDSFFDNAVEVDLEGSKFFNGPFSPTQAALQKIINPQSFNQVPSVLSKDRDLEDFESAIFDPVVLSRPGGTPPRSIKTTNDLVTFTLSDSEKENDSQTSRNSEFKSPVNQEGNPKFFCEGYGNIRYNTFKRFEHEEEACLYQIMENVQKANRQPTISLPPSPLPQHDLLNRQAAALEDKIDANDPSDLSNTRDKHKSEPSPATLFSQISKSHGNELPAEQANRSTSRQNYRNPLVSKRRKARPFRSRLKNVLATKALANVSQAGFPSPCPVKSVNVDSSGETRNQATPNTPIKSQTTPKPTTTPRSKKIWSKSKSATPKNRNAQGYAVTSPVSIQSSSNQTGSEDAKMNDNMGKEVASPKTPTSDPIENAIPPIQHPSDEKAREERIESPTAQSFFISRATTFSHRETPSRSIVQSKSEIPPSSWDFQNERNIGICVATDSFEIQNTKLNGTRNFCCSPRVALSLEKKQARQAKSAPEPKAQSQENKSTAAKKEANDKVNDQAPSPPPPPPPTTPLPQAVSCTSTRAEIHHQVCSFPPPPPPPLRPLTPPRVILMKLTGTEQQVTKETLEEARVPNQLKADKADQKQNSFKLPEACFEPSQHEKFYPAVDANEESMMREMDIHKPTLETLEPRQEAKERIDDAIKNRNTSSEIDDAIHDLSNMLKTDSNDTVSSECMSQILNSASSDASNDKGDAGRKPKSRLRKTMGKMRFLKGKKKKKTLPLPRHPPHSADTAEEAPEDPLVEWFDTRNSKSSDPSTDESTRNKTWGKSIVVDELDLKGACGVRPKKSPIPNFSSGLIKAATSDKEALASDLIYWGSAEDFEVIAVDPSNQLAAVGESWVDGRNIHQPAPEKLAKVMDVLKKAKASKCGDLQMQTRRADQHSRAADSSGSAKTNIKNTNQSPGTLVTNKATRGVRASPQADKVLTMLGQPGTESKPPQIGATIVADLFVSACSTLSESSRSDGSASTGSYSGSDDDDSCASDSAILTSSVVFTEDPTKLSQLSQNKTPGGLQLQASTSDSDDDIFSNIDDGDSEGGRTQLFENTASKRASILSCTPCNAQVNQSMGSGQGGSRETHRIMTSHSHSLVDRSLSTSSSAEYSSASELDNVEAHVQMAQEWLHKLKSAFLGNDDDESTAANNSTIGTVQCEYAGVLGRFKIDINQNK